MITSILSQTPNTNKMIFIDLLDREKRELREIQATQSASKEKITRCYKMITKLMKDGRTTFVNCLMTTKIGISVDFRGYRFKKFTTIVVK